MNRRAIQFFSARVAPGLLAAAALAGAMVLGSGACGSGESSSRADVDAGAETDAQDCPATIPRNEFSCEGIDAGPGCVGEPYHPLNPGTPSGTLPAIHPSGCSYITHFDCAHFQGFVVNEGCYCSSSCYCQVGFGPDAGFQWICAL